VRKASPPRRDPVEVDGETMESPSMTKQKLDGSDEYDVHGFHECYDLGRMTAVY